jgi:hypothetical protein
MQDFFNGYFSLAYPSLVLLAQLLSSLENL